MDNYNCKSVPEFIRFLETTIDYLEKKNGSNLGDLFTAQGKKVNAGTANYTIVAKLYHEELSMGNFQAQPWCDMAVCVWFVYAFGIEKAKKMLLGFFSYVDSHMKAFRNAGKLDQKPRVGDPVFYWTASLGRYAHTGVVVGVDNNGIGFTTIEGNTSSGNNIVERNGGAIARKHYNSIPYKVMFGHIDYEKYGISLTEVPVPDPYIPVGTGVAKIVALQGMDVFDNNWNKVGYINPTERFDISNKKYYDGKTYFEINTGVGTGWAHLDHAEGWVLEKNTGEWWYLIDSYQWWTSCFQKINEVWYYFNDAGYCAMNQDIVLYADESGAIKITNSVTES